MSACPVGSREGTGGLRSPPCSGSVRSGGGRAGSPLRRDRGNRLRCLHCAPGAAAGRNCSGAGGALGDLFSAGALRTAQCACSIPAGGQHHGLRDAVCDGPTNLCPLRRHVRWYWPEPEPGRSTAGLRKTSLAVPSGKASLLCDLGCNSRRLGQPDWRRGRLILRLPRRIEAPGGPGHGADGLEYAGFPNCRA